MTDVQYHVVDHIRNAQMIEDPFRFCIVPNCLPAQYVRDMMENLPNEEGLVAEMPQYKERFFYWLQMNGKVTPGLPKFWSEFVGMFPALKATLMDKFSIGGSYTSAQLLIDKPGFSVGPHNDSPNKTATGLFYLPDNDKHPEAGTEIMRGKFADVEDLHHPFNDNFETVMTAPYLPGMGLFFARTDWSYHAVRPTTIKRRVIAFDIFA